MSTLVQFPSEILDSSELSVSSTLNPRQTSAELSINSHHNLSQKNSTTGYNISNPASIATTVSNSPNPSPLSTLQSSIPTPTSYLMQYPSSISPSNIQSNAQAVNAVLANFNYFATQQLYNNPANSIQLQLQQQQQQQQLHYNHQLLPATNISRDQSYISVDSDDLNHFQQNTANGGSVGIIANNSNSSNPSLHTLLLPSHQLMKQTSSSSNSSGSQLLSNSTQPNLCKLVVKYLPPQLTQDSLHSLFSQYGTLLSCKLILDKKSGTSLGYGFVIYSTAEQAQSAIHNLNGFVLNNRPIRVTLAQPPDAHGNNSKSTVYLSGLPISYGLAELSALTSVYGQVLDSKILCDLNTGISRGIGFVQMESSAAARKCIENLHGKVLNEGGEALIVKFAKEFRRDSFHNNAIQQQSNILQTAVNIATVNNNSNSNTNNTSINPTEQLTALYLQQQAAAAAAVQAQAQVLFHHQAAAVVQQQQQQAHAQAAAAVQNLAAMNPSSPSSTTHNNITALTNLLNSNLTPSQLRAIESQYGNKKSGYSLFVFHLPPELTESELTQLFTLNNTVSVMSVSLAPDPTDPSGKLSRGFGFVNMNDFPGAVKCVRVLNGMQIGRKFIKVQFKNRTNQPTNTSNPKHSIAGSSIINNNSSSTSPLTSNNILSNTITPPLLSTPQNSNIFSKLNNY